MVPAARLQVSVIVPCYKQAHFLHACVRSVLDQGRDDVEVVIVDDGSPDDTAVLAAGFGPPVKLVRQPNCGLPAARNAGVRAATGSLLMFLDADDAQAAGAIAAVMAVAAADPTADVMCGGWQDMDAGGTPGAEHAPPAAEVDPWRLLLPHNAAPPCCWAVRRTALAAVGGFH
ncbi:MAG: kfoC [Phycisphaerales bacterium]|nr:kfoC [Phycisphaerales bacterium]